MLILLIIATIALIWLLVELDGEILIGGVAVGLTIEIIALICCISSLVNMRIIDEKIELYTTQNQEIEEKIETTVKEYMDYEGETLKELKSDSYITLISLYPELKSDEMIKQQIELYISNKEEITYLKNKKLKKTVYKWWIYFGK